MTVSYFPLLLKSIYFIVNYLFCYRNKIYMHLLHIYPGGKCPPRPPLPGGPPLPLIPGGPPLIPPPGPLPRPPRIIPPPRGGPPLKYKIKHKILISLVIISYTILSSMYLLSIFSICI